MSQRIISILVLFFVSYAVLAQPVNNICDSAIPISNTDSWCSNAAQHTNQGATSTITNPPNCFVSPSHDVWFSFVATAQNVNVSVVGNTFPVPGGTLNNPEVALFSGVCGGLFMEECRSDGVGTDVAELYFPDLIIGDTYYLAVDGRGAQTGSFQLCINTFNPIPEPSSDCNTAVLLCDKSSFTVESVIGAGFDPNEIDGAPCVADPNGNGTSCIYGEDNSAWYKWTCKDSGPLTFTLSPSNPADDLDFWVFELPGGLDDCQNKVPQLCMASGENVGAPIAEWAICTGATGASSGDPDDQESCGCQPGNNNFVKPLNMVAGRSYALIVENFSGTGNGFSIEFGGSGTFLGPEAAFTSDPPNEVCWGESVTFTDNSSAPVSPIVGWDWNFGQDAIPQFATGPGPHTVGYTSPGIKNITLTVESQLGCLITETSTIFVDPCCFPIDVAIIKQDVLCPDDTDGAIDLTVTGMHPPFDFSWNTGAITEDISGLSAGDYTVVISDLYDCDTTVVITIDSPPIWEVEIDITRPTCAGGMDGTIVLSVSGATPPYQYNWNNTGFTASNTLTNLPISDHTVIIRDSEGCETTRFIEVRELELNLDPDVQVYIEPLCTGDSNGSITIAISNGFPPYQYDFNDGNGFVSNNSLNNIPTGTYDVDVIDANGCKGTFHDIIIGEPAPLGLSITPMAVSCYGDSDGVVTSFVTGGTPSYGYLWNTPDNASSPSVSNLAPGVYSLVVTDANGCLITSSAEIAEPGPVTITDITPIDNECFGGEAGSLIVTAAGGSRPFEYSVDGINFQTDSVLAGLAAGTYTVYVRDVFNCTFEETATITEPFQIIVIAREDQVIDLGYTANIQAIVNTSDEHTYAWTPAATLSCSDCPFPTASPVVTTTYYVEVVTDKGCIAIDSVTITVNAVRPVYIPNVFTPNYDGVNDNFFVLGGRAIAQVKNLDIYNRWGGHVFHAENTPSNDGAFGWDGNFNGKPVNPGVFVYVAKVEFLDGVVLQYQGDVTVLK